MPELYRILEISLYGILHFFPFMAIAFIPYRTQLRHSPLVTYIILGGGDIVHILLFCLAEYTQIPGWQLTLGTLLVNCVCYFTVFSAHKGQQVFTLLMLTNVGNFVSIAAKCLEYALFPALAVEQFRWSLSLCTVLVELAALCPLYLYVKHTYKIIFNKKASVSTWWYLWLIPGTFYMIWYYHIYGEGNSVTSLATDEFYVLFSFFMNLGAILIYQTVVELIKTTAKSQELDEHNHLLNLQTLQYEDLQYRIDEARMWRHDSRHHLAVMESYLDSGEYDKLRSYIDRYKMTLPNDRNLIFCQHRAVNALLMFFGQMANDNGADYDVVVQIPQDIPILEHDLTVLIGNLVENAAQACKSVESGPRAVTVNGKTTDSALYFEVSNTFGGELKQNNKGHFLSTKREGRGLGLRSIRNIVEKYDGIIEITPKDGIFTVEIYLPFK